MKKTNEGLPNRKATGGAAQPGTVPDTAADDAVVIPFHRYTEFGRNWPVPGSREVLVVPLGGLGRIGMNWTLYGHDGHWLLVDAGIAFGGPERPEVEAIIPDPSFLAPIAKRLLGLVVTHGHEDHIGAVDRLWPASLDCPVWATPFAAGLLSRRFEEAGTLGQVDLRRFRPGEQFAIGPFRLNAIAMTHSIPEPVALAITTGAGTVLHSGDWKFDPEPMIGPPADLAGLQALGDAGVLALLCDSTNAHKDLPATSEAEVREAFRALFAKRRGRIAVCCFATNVARMASAVIAATEAGRQVALAGRSMRSCAETARELGLLDDVPETLAEPSHLEGLDRHQLALICTGGQGEERAALARLARGDRRLPAFGPGDTVVLSARVIPGNEAAVEAVVTRLRRRGVEVLMGDERIDDRPLHVTGHPGAQELRRLYQLVRPRFALPVHGTEMHLTAHARLARDCGVAAALVTEEAELIRLAPGGARVLGRVEAPLLHLARTGNGDRTLLRAVAGA